MARRRGGARRVGGRRFGPVRRRGMRGIRRARAVRQPVQFFKRSVYLSGALTASSAADVYGSNVFSLNAIPNHTEFTALYDQYKINMIKIQYIPRGNSTDIQTGTTTGQSTGLFTVLDYDDNNVPTSIDELMQYQNMKMSRSHQIHKRIIKPLARINVVGSLGAGVNGMYGHRNPWIDCNSPNVPHFGIKYAIQQVPNGSQIYDVKIDYYLAFKNVR